MSRGRGDFLSSHDLEGVLTLVDGRPSIVDALRAASRNLRQFVGETIRALLSAPRFEDYLPGLLADSSRTNICRISSDWTHPISRDGYHLIS